MCERREQPPPKNCAHNYDLFSARPKTPEEDTHVMVMECTQHPTALLTLIVSGCMSNTN